MSATNIEAPANEIPLLAARTLAAPRLDAQGPDWVRALRQAGIDRYRRAGFPDSREERWRFTDLKAIRRKRFGFDLDPDPGRLGAEELARISLGSAIQPRFTLVDGVFAPELSALDNIPEGLTLLSLRRALEARPDAVEPHLGQIARASAHRFAALNDAFLHDGAVVLAERGCCPRLPVHLLFISTENGEPRMTFPRVLIVTEQGAEVTVLQEYTGTDEGIYLTNSVTEIAVAENASVSHYRVQRESGKAYHLAAVAARQAAHSRFTSYAVSLGARLARVDVDVHMEGEGSESVLDGLYMVSGRQHIDHHTLIDHAASHTASRELYKGVLDGKSSAVFNGRVRIAEGTRAIDSSQVNRNLLLSPQALVNTNPELEIFADDVKATHGATIGQLDRDQLFYLRSRGVDFDQARKILIRGFAGEMLERIAIEPVRDRLVDTLGKRF
jgi:Fe-S cluster assembly protein SufD